MMRFLLLCAAASSLAFAQDGDAKKGKELFLKYTCYGCHGFSGQNGPGARLVPMKMAQSAFFGYVRNPPRANIMPSYSAKVAPDSVLADIYAYIKTLPDSNAPAKSIPVLNSIINEK